MTDDLTADDLPESEIDSALMCLGFDASETWPEYSHTSLREAWRDGYDSGAAAAQRLTPPPHPGTVTELDLIVFLEWLDSTRQVTEWGDPNATHEDTAREYLAQVPPSGNVTVSADDLRYVLSKIESRHSSLARLDAALTESVSRR